MGSGEASKECNPWDDHEGTWAGVWWGEGKNGIPGRRISAGKQYCSAEQHNVMENLQAAKDGRNEGAVGREGGRKSG